MGSSGIRLGSNSGEANEAESRPINYLADLNENNDRFKVTTVDKTVGWFQVLRAETELPSDCKTVAGGFSAWRRAVQDADPDEVADVLAHIHHRTGVALYVIPLEEEGKYGYRAAQAALDEQLTTQAIWDIGGGSMQIAQEDAAWGSALGQRGVAQAILREDQARFQAGLCTESGRGRSVGQCHRGARGLRRSSSRYVGGPLHRHCDQPANREDNAPDPKVPCGASFYW